MACSTPQLNGTTATRHYITAKAQNRGYLSHKYQPLPVTIIALLTLNDTPLPLHYQPQLVATNEKKIKKDKKR
jgi:DNA topoisomerase IA